MKWSDLTNNSGILQEIKRSLKEPVGTDQGHWLDSDLLRRANMVMRQVCEVSECLKLLNVSNTSVSGTSQYTKPADCSRIVGVAYGNNRLFGILKAELDIISSQSANSWQNWSGPPARYIDQYPQDDTITIVPTPTDTGILISIEYMGQPSELVNDTDIPFNAQTNLYSFHDLIVAGVVYRCMLEDKNQFYIEWKSIYETGMKRLKEFVNKMPDTLMTTILVGGGQGRNISPLPFNRGF
jgi:hypothetical protein